MTGPEDGTVKIWNLASSEVANEVFASSESSDFRSVIDGLLESDEDLFVTLAIGFSPFYVDTLLFCSYISSRYCVCVHLIWGEFTSPADPVPTLLLLPLPSLLSVI